MENAPQLMQILRPRLENTGAGGADAPAKLSVLGGEYCQKCVLIDADTTPQARKYGPKARAEGADEPAKRSLSGITLWSLSGFTSGSLWGHFG